MITNSIQSTPFDEIVVEINEARTPEALEKAKQRMLALTGGWGMGLQYKAVEEFKALCKHQGLVLCDEKSLNTVLSASAIHESAHEAFMSIKTDRLNSTRTVSDLEPEFTIKEDEDLNQLLNWTASLVGGGANMDTGIIWNEALEKVLFRLKTAKVADVESEDSLVLMGQLRYLVHMVVARHLGFQVLTEFKHSSKTLRAIDDLSSWLPVFDEWELEMGIDIDARSRQRFMSMYGQAVMEDLVRREQVRPRRHQKSEVRTQVLDRAELEKRLANVAFKHFPANDWYEYQENARPFIYLLRPATPDDNSEFDDYSEFDQAVKNEFQLPGFLVTGKGSLDALLQMRYNDLVAIIASRGAK